MQGPQCPSCHGREWQLVDHEERRERWPVVAGETIYRCGRCGRLGVRSWVESHGTDPLRRSFRDTWEFPEGGR
ncbi:MAG: hypothetical protein KatS3mg102_0076 [Planctomycetota bacterium]|nr:MAG: hypothetical protein KatS3mg102_0076 [Planctomycetota bacterium]